MPDSPEETKPGDTEGSGSAPSTGTEDGDNTKEPETPVDTSTPDTPDSPETPVEPNPEQPVNPENPETVEPEKPKANWTSYMDGEKKKNILWAKGITPSTMGEGGSFVKVPIGTDYVNYEAPYERNKGWYDTNKKGVDEDQSIDRSLCFAAVATNMIYWWQDQNKEEIKEFLAYLESKKYFEGKPENTIKDIRYLFNSYGEQKNSAIYNMFTLYFFSHKAGYQTDILADFYINGYSPKPLGGTNDEKDEFKFDDRAGFFHEVFKNKKLTNRMFSGNLTSFSGTVKTLLENGSIAGLQYITTGTNSHIVTLWGAEYDDSGKVSAIYVTDSDDQDDAHKLGMRRYLVREVDGRTVISTNVNNPRHGSKVEYLHTLDLGKSMWKTFLDNIKK